MCLSNLPGLVEAISRKKGLKHEEVLVVQFLLHSFMLHQTFSRFV